MTWYIAAIIYLAYIVGYMVGRLAEVAENKKKSAPTESTLWKKVSVDKEKITEHLSARNN
jgi:hypothetical protein